MTIEDQLKHHSQSLDKLLSCVYELRAEVAALRESPMSNADVCDYLGITPATLLNWRKFKGFPEFATKAKIQAWYEAGNGKGKPAA